MEHLTAEQLASLRTRIEAERDELRRRLALHESEARAADEERDEQDLAAREQERTNAVMVAGRERGRLRALEAALSRMREGSYGICEETDEEIPFGRLQAEPTARYTVEGLEQLERDGRSPELEPESPGAY